MSSSLLACVEYSWISSDIVSPIKSLGLPGDCTVVFYVRSHTGYVARSLCEQVDPEPTKPSEPLFWVDYTPGNRILLWFSGASRKASLALKTENQTLASSFVLLTLRLFRLE